ncbi:hypothetical protein [Pseudidiomarina atlantica]|uniref:hypothetical protein n=1 Tax=Pseudidiomarina atlantica TaxID=1517416 RepID=UPI000689825B|nr:hypothetical protein [Pseudidiomarina atlantica]
MKLTLLAASAAFLLSGCVIYVDGKSGNIDWGDRDLIHDTRQLSLAVADLEALDVLAGAGSLVIEGDSTIDAIEVTAEVYHHDTGDIRFSLEAQGDTAFLVATFDNSSYGSNNPYMDVTVRMPQDLLLKVDDGSGNITVNGSNGDVVIDDGSGSMLVENVRGEVTIDDGSGDIEVREVGKLTIIESGSGSVKS